MICAYMNINEGSFAYCASMGDGTGIVHVQCGILAYSCENADRKTVRVLCLRRQLLLNKPQYSVAFNSVPQLHVTGIVHVQCGIPVYSA